MAQYDHREQELGEELMREIERLLLLQIIDQRWREHLYDMDYLREGIHLRGFAQIEPLVAYKNEAFELFRDLMNTIWGDFTRMIFNVQVTLQDPADLQPPPPPRRPSAASSSATGGGRVTYSGGTGMPAGAQAIAAAAAEAGAVGAPGMIGMPGVMPGVPGGGVPVQEQAPPAVVQRRVEEPEPGRNDPCWCGSGKKYKKCHGA